MKRRVGFLGTFVGGSLFLLISLALAQRVDGPRTPAPAPSQEKENHAAPAQSAMENIVDEENSPLPQEKPNSAGRPSATEKAREEQGVGEMTALLREHLPVSQVLEFATLLIAVETIIFAIFLGAFGYFEWARYKKLQEDVANERKTLDKKINDFNSDLKDQREELAKEQCTLHASVETFKEDLKIQEQKLIAYQRFLDAVLSQHSDLLVGLVEGFGSALRPEEDRKLRSLIFEAGAVLDLFHPDKIKVGNALWHLEQIGADNAVSSLVQLRDDPAAESEIRVRAQIVLSKIQERLKEERTKPVMQKPLHAGPHDHPPEDQTGRGDPQLTSPRRKRGSRAPAQA